MKKITLKIFMIMFLLGTYISVSQTLNQNAAWPNVAWTVTGTYNAAATAFEADPTTTANFAFDDDDAGNGSDDDIAAESPVIDLTAASGAGETWITISGDYVYNRNTGDILQFEYWDADAGTWNLIGAAFPADTAGAPNDNFCGAVAEAYTTTVLNIAAFTPTQLSGFRYRIYYDDTVGGAGWEWGFCFQSPTIVSATPPACPDPSTLTATNIGGFSADFGWTENGTATTWNIELVDITAAGVVTGTATNSGVTNPFNQTGLVPSNDYEFYVQADCGGSTSTWVGPFAFSTTVACPGPSALTATNIMTTTADLGWTVGGSEALWDVELVDVTAGGVQTMTATATGVANPYMATGLVAANDYEFYVRADCAANGTSTWVGPFAFTAACIAIPAPYTEDFETFATAGTAFVGGNCWTGTGGPYYWESAPGTDVGSGGTGPDPTITTGNYFYIEASGGTAGDTTDLVSPLVDLTALTAPSLLFNYHMFGGDMGTLDVLVNGTTNVFTITGQQQASATAAWELAVIDLSAYAGQTISITFRGTSVGIFEGDISIDNVVFDELPACPLPSMLTATTITDTTADFGWTENGTATVWDVELVDVTAGGVQTMTATATGVANPYMATGLTANNNYSFYVRSDCGGGSTSAWVGPFAFTTACITFTAPYSEDFENGGTVPACWTLGGDENWLFNTTGPNQVGNGGTLSGATTSGNYYAVVDDSAPDATNAQLDSPFVDLSGLTTPALSFFEISSTQGNPNATLTVSVWDGAAWNVVGTYNTDTAAGWELKVIDLSGLTFTGPAQARFSVADSGSFYDDIAIDDVSFDELPACIQPSAASASSITETSADIGWTENNGSMAWEIVVQAAGTGVPGGAGTATATNPYSVTLLTAGTDYEAYIRTDCGGGTFSAWTGPINFTTLSPPPANNDCSGAIALTNGGIFTDNPVVGTNVGATDSGELAPGCASFLGGDVWYSAVVPADGALTLEINPETGGLGDTGGAVYSGTCGSLVLVACNDDGSTSGAHPIININDAALANQTVYFRVWEFGNNATGEFQVSAYAASLSVESVGTRGFSHYIDNVNNKLVINAQSRIDTIEIYNLVGQVITTTQPREASANVNLGSMRTGIYFARVILQDGRISIVKFSK